MNGQVTVNRAIFSTKEDWAERDRSQAPDHSLCDVHTLFLGVWPCPPRRSEWVWFAVYAYAGDLEIELTLSSLTDHSS